MEPRDVNALICSRSDHGRSLSLAARMTTHGVTTADARADMSSGVDLAEQILAFASVLRGAAREALVFRVNLGGATASDALDTTQFKAALLNLVVNAREATPGRGELTLSADVVDLNSEADISPRIPAGRYAAVSVTDHGAGAVLDAQEPMSGAFVRDSRGLGLSQVHGFATQCGGGISIDSAMGQGTSVTIYLPVLEMA